MGDPSKIEGRSLEGWGAAVQAASLGHAAEDILELTGAQDPNPEHVGRLDFQHPDHPEVIGPQPGVHHELRKYQVDPSLDVFYATHDSFGAPSALTAIGSGSAEDFAKNLTRKGTTKGVHESVRDLHMEGQAQEAFERNLLDAMMPLSLQGYDHVLDAMQEAASKLSAEQKSLLGFDSEGYTHAVEHIKRVKEYGDKVESALAEGKTYDEVFEELGPFEAQQSMEEGRQELEELALRGQTFERRVQGKPAMSGGGRAETDETPTPEEQEEIETVRQMDTTERDEYILRAQQDGTGYWGRMQKAKNGQVDAAMSSKEPAKAAAKSDVLQFSYPEPSPELLGALKSFSSAVKDYEAKHGIDFCQLGVNRIML